MPDKSLGFGDYLKAAFFRKVNVPLLGAVPLNLMLVGVFGVLGIANPGFWLLGAAVELGLVTATAASERFQKVVQGEALQAAQQRFDHKVQKSIVRLSPAGRERYRRLLQECRRILGITEGIGRDDLGGNLADMKARNLNQLLGIFLRLLASRESIVQNLKDLDRDILALEIADLQERLAKIGDEADPALRRSLEGTLEIQQRRLENLERADKSLRVIDSELARIEQQVELIREESAVSGGPGALSTRLDSVTATMTETHRWMDENRDLLGPAGQDEDFELPALPTILEEET
ncbi:MAG: hypothetical protein AAF481_13100 [Acidobacteriota bacterium]